MKGAAIELTNNRALIGAAGVYFVAAELSLRGLIALPTIRNTAGIDIVVSSCDGEWHANLQVKTSGGNGPWPLGNDWETWNGPNNYYVFVRYLKADARFEAFLETSKNVIKQRRRHNAAREAVGRPLKPPFNWHLEGKGEVLIREWLLLGSHIRPSRSPAKLVKG